MGKMKYISIGVPSLGHTSMHWAIAFGDLCPPLNYATNKIVVLGKPVAEARNEVVQRAFNYSADNREVTHLFWLDDDVILHRCALIQLFTRRVPVVSGVYFTKRDPGELLSFPGPCQGTTEFVPNAYHPVWGHGSGLTLVAMDVYRRMKDELDIGVDQFGYPAWYKTIKDEPTTIDGEIVVNSFTEDLYFCSQLERMGIPRMIDMSRSAFGFHYDAKEQTAYPAKQWEEFKTNGRFTWDTPDGPVTWER